MKIIFVNGAYSDLNIAQLNHATGSNLQIASHVFQQGIIKGLIDNNAEFDVVSAPFVPSYPINNSLLFNPNASYCYKGENVGETIRFCTLLGFKERSVYKNLYKVIKKKIDTIDDASNISLLIYSPYGPFLKVASELKINYPSLRVCLIVTDRFCNSVRKLKDLTWKNRIRLFYEARTIEKSIACVDKYVLLADRLTEYAPFAIGNYIIIEGIYHGSDVLNIDKFVSSNKTLLYTGSLDVHSSIKELVDAFLLTTNPNYRLQICGTGFYSEYIKKVSLSDERVKYLGVVPRDEVLNLQKKATALINPRMPSVEDTPYSFPSKTIEYLASGTPMIGYRLEGIPSEYYSFFYQIEKPTIKSMAQTIEAVLNKPQEELNQKAIAAFDFIVNYKTARGQVRKIIDYLE